MRASLHLMSETPPPGFLHLREGACRVVVADRYADAVAALGLLERGGLERLLHTASGAEGRAGTALATLPGSDTRLHVRPVRHGGWLRALGGDRFFGLGRPLAELQTTAKLAAAGAPVPRVVFVAGRRRAGPIWRAVLATIHEEATRDGESWLRAAADSADAARAAAAVGNAVRRLHDAGGRHADLHVNNVLLRESDTGLEAIVIDLDRGRVVPRVTPRERMAEIMRLYRSLVKRDLLAQVGPGVCTSFLESYTGGDARLRDALLRHLPRERRRLARHRLLYR